MENFSVVILLLAVLLSLYPLIDKLKLPQPIFLVLVGLLIGLVPFFPNLVLDPEIIFLVVLPPLLFDAATQTSWLDFKTNFIANFHSCRIMLNKDINRKAGRLAKTIINYITNLKNRY